MPSPPCDCTIDVNVNGITAHVKAEARFCAPPAILGGILANEDQTGVFRHVVSTPTRVVVKEEPGYREVDVEQISVLERSMKNRDTTTMHMVEDTRDQNNMTYKFTMVASDTLSSSSGIWKVQPLEDCQSGGISGSRVTLEQEITPKGIPWFVRGLPVVRNMMQREILKSITHVTDDIQAVVNLTAQGKTLAEALAQKKMTTASNQENPELF